MFPTPRILRIKNKVKETEIIKPLFLFNKRVDVNKRKSKKNKTTKRITTPGVEGSVKYTRPDNRIKSNIIAKKVEK